MRGQPIYPKIASLLTDILNQASEELKDVESKRKDPDILPQRTIEEIIEEVGFGYINSIIDTLNNIDLNVLLHFLSLLNLLKGHRDGLELVLNVLGFESEIVEWWELSPKGEPQTFDMEVYFNLSNVDNVFNTLDKIRIFTEHYVYPKFVNANVNFDFEFVSSNTLLAGFVDNTVFGEITGTL